MFIKLANELDAEEYFEHPFIMSSPITYNSYLFFFGSSTAHPVTLDALADARLPKGAGASLPQATAVDALANETVAHDIFARAMRNILQLDAIGITERFNESVDSIFKTLDLPAPQAITPAQVTDELPKLYARLSPVPPVAMTSRLSRALEALTEYDRQIYGLAEQELERRLAALRPGLNSAGSEGQDTDAAPP